MYGVHDQRGCDLVMAMTRLLYKCALPAPREAAGLRPLTWQRACCAREVPTPCVVQTLMHPPTRPARPACRDRAAVARASPHLTTCSSPPLRSRRHHCRCRRCWGVRCARRCPTRPALAWPTRLRPRPGQRPLRAPRRGRRRRRRRLRQHGRRLPRSRRRRARSRPCSYRPGGRRAAARSHRGATRRRRLPPAVGQIVPRALAAQFRARGQLSLAPALAEQASGGQACRLAGPAHCGACLRVCCSAGPAALQPLGPQAPARAPLSETRRRPMGCPHARVGRHLPGFAVHARPSLRQARR